MSIRWAAPLLLAASLLACAPADNATVQPNAPGVATTGAETETSAERGAVPPLRPASPLRSPADDRREEVQAGLSPPK